MQQGAPNQRDAITRALMNIQAPPPQTRMPQMPPPQQAIPQMPQMPPPGAPPMGTPMPQAPPSSMPLSPGMSPPMGAGAPPMPQGMPPVTADAVARHAARANAATGRARLLSSRRRPVSKPDPPTPPNPIATAAAQTGTNVSTGGRQRVSEQRQPGHADRVLTYNVTGSHQWTDPSTGQTYTIPTFTATQTQSPTGQQLQSLNDQTKINLAGMGLQQSAIRSRTCSATRWTSPVRRRPATRRASSACRRPRPPSIPAARSSPAYLRAQPTRQHRRAPTARPTISRPIGSVQKAPDGAMQPAARYPEAASCSSSSPTRAFATARPPTTTP